jgi:hypothetical protein
MKKLKLIPILAVVALICAACASQSRVVYNTLASIQVATAGAYNGYLSLVVQGKVTTNAVPQISRDFNLFQQTWSAAVMIAQFNTNTTAPQIVLDQSAAVISEINIAKGVQ